MKKILFFIAGIWVSFMAFLVFREQIDQILDGSPEDPVPIVQKSVQDDPAPPLDAPKISVSPPVPVEEPNQPKNLPIEEVPFAPLPEMDEKQASDKEGNLEVADSKKRLLPCLLPEKNNADNQLAANLSNPFGLIITKFERLPSRFRLVSWKGNDLVELEDMKKFNPIEKTFSRHWIGGWGALCRVDESSGQVFCIQAFFGRRF